MPGRLAPERRMQSSLAPPDSSSRSPLRFVGRDSPCRVRRQCIASVSNGMQFRGRVYTTPVFIEIRPDRRVLLNDRCFQFTIAFHPNVETQQPVDGMNICVTSLRRVPPKDALPAVGMM